MRIGNGVGTRAVTEGVRMYVRMKYEVKWG